MPARLLRTNNPVGRLHGDLELTSVTRQVVVEQDATHHRVRRAWAPGPLMGVVIVHETDTIGITVGMNDAYIRHTACVRTGKAKSGAIPRA